MLWDASVIKEYSVAGSDGPLGTANDFLFDDVSWKIRWLTVDTGRWFFDRKALIPASALGRPDPVLRKFSVKLTMRQARKCHDINYDPPVSRQAGTELHDYYGWDPRWTNGYFGEGAITVPVMPSLGHPIAHLPDPGTVDTPKKTGDQHLRSVEEVIGYHVHATDGEIGHVEDVLVDEPGWNIHYFKVDTRNWLPGARVLVSPLSVSMIDWGDRTVFLDVDRQKVRHSPPYDPSITVDGAYEEAFLTYYGIKWVRP